MIAYILRHDSERSHEYAATCAESCERAGQKWVYHDNSREQFTDDIYPLDVQRQRHQYLGHVDIWKRIAESGEGGMVLEHDMYLYHAPPVPPVGVLAMIGYRLPHPDMYRGGPPVGLRAVRGWTEPSGYAMSNETAKRMSESGVYYLEHQYFEPLTRNITSFKIEQHDQYFLPQLPSRDERPYRLALYEPIAGVNWTRESTIHSEPSTDNPDLSDSFVEGLSVALRRNKEDDL